MKTIIALLIALAACAQTKPDPQLTPGVADPAVTQATLGQTVCAPGYTLKVRDVPEGIKRAVALEYGLKLPLKPGAFEVDHWIPLEIGGDNDIRNLWPQPALPIPGFRQKDRVETYLKRQVCSGAMTLRQAQEDIPDWVEIWKQLEVGKLK
jgi:hypothetical protein